MKEPDRPTRTPPATPWSNGDARKKRGFPNAAKALIALVLLLAAAAVQYFYFGGQAPAAGNALRMAETGVSFKYDFDSAASFHSFDSGSFFYCTKDGMKYMTSSGAQRWDSVYSLAAPVMVAQGQVVAVGEANGRAVYVFGASGRLYERRFDAPLLSFSVNKAGWLSVIIQEGDGYLIEVFGPGGGKLSQYHFIESNVYPISADVSADGRIVATAFADVEFQLVTRIVFQYINEAEGRNFTDSIFSEQRIPGEMPASVRFMDGNNLLVFTDARIRCYQTNPDSAVGQIWDIALDNKVSAVGFYGGKSFAYAAGDALLNHSDPDEPGTVNFISSDGVKTGSYCVGKIVQTLSMGFDAAIAGTGRDFCAIDRRGNLLWSYASPQEARQMLFLDSVNTVLVATDMGGSVMKRVKARP